MMSAPLIIESPIITSFHFWEDAAIWVQSGSSVLPLSGSRARSNSCMCWNRLDTPGSGDVAPVWCTRPFQLALLSPNYLPLTLGAKPSYLTYDMGFKNPN
uniref:Uncharacterized protein n=1 Tax=Anguilla anguilla TaxID=7936 RepID=A0A0E9PG62_ANGAN